jgi:hypothetical protein
MMAERNGGVDEGREGRESFENGVSAEGEFAFTKAVAAYCKEAVREGSFRGSYVLNIKEQMEQRAVRAEREGEVKRLKVGFHMTEPTKLTMGERRQVVDRTVELVVGVQKEFPFAEVWYLTMFPRHVVRCCGKDSHMSEDDC